MNVDKKLKEELKKLGLHLKSLRESKSLTLNEMAKKTGIRKEYLIKAIIYQLPQNPPLLKN